MTSSSSGKQKPKRSTASGSESARSLDRRVLDLDQKFFLSPVTGLPVRVDQATDEEFDLFIREYVQMKWTLEDRIDALVDAILDDQEVAFCEPEKGAERREKLG